MNGFKAPLGFRIPCLLREVWNKLDAMLKQSRWLSGQHDFIVLRDGFFSASRKLSGSAVKRVKKQVGNKNGEDVMFLGLYADNQ